MIIFDNEYLKQYLEQGVELKVFVNREWYAVTDITDVESSQYGLGIDVQGKPTTFRYSQIEQINADGNIMTIDQLQDKAAGTEPEDAGAEDTGGEDMAAGDAGGGPANAGGGPKPEKVPGTGGEEGAPPEEETPEPPQEVYRRVVANMIVESNKKPKDAPFESGDFVENIDRRSEYMGSRGVVKEVTMPKDKGAMTTVEYRIFNYGYAFKPGQTVTVPASALQKIESGTHEPKSKR